MKDQDPSTVREHAPSPTSRREGWLDALGALVWGSREDGEVEAGPQWRAYTGRGGVDWLEAVHEDDRAPAAALPGDALARGAASRELRIRDARGDFRWFLVNAGALPGSPARWVALAVDVDARRRADEAARVHARYARALLGLSKKLERAETREEVVRAVEEAVREVTRFSRVWVYLLDADREHADLYFGRGLAADPLLSRLTIRGDRLLEEIAEATDMVVVDDARTDPRTDKAIVAYLGNRTIINVPILLPERRLGTLGTGTFGDEGVHPPSGEERSFLSTLGSHAAIALDRVASNDVRREAEARLAESEERHRQIFDNAAESLFLAEVGEDGRFRLLSANRAFEERTGLRLEGSLGKTPEENLPPEAADAINAHYRRVVAAGAMLREEIDLHLPTGTRTLDSTLIPVRDASGRVYRIVGLSADITEKRAAELALRRLNRTLRTLSFGNEALVRATTEEDLLARMCRVLVEHGGYRMTWIGLRDPVTGALHARASAGHEAGYLEERGSGEGDIAADSCTAGAPRVVRDIAALPPGPLRDAALARGYRSAVALPLHGDGGVSGAITLFSADVAVNDDAEMSLLVELSEDLAYGLHALRTRRDRERSLARLQSAMDAVIQALGSMVELRDPYTAGHQRRVAQLSAAIGRVLGFGEERIQALHVAGSVHDVGKICVPAEILTRPGKLSRVEFEIIKPHVEAGWEILRPIDFDWPIAEIVRQHHERIDGTGYPRGLAGDEILLEARILAVADVVEAMTNHRPYRPALGMGAALAEIRRGRGTIFDPDVVDACGQILADGSFHFT